MGEGSLRGSNSEVKLMVVNGGGCVGGLVTDDFYDSLT